MLTRGISSNKLVADLYEGNTQNVPVGQTPLTNTFELNSPNVYPQTLGVDLVQRKLSDFEVVGEEFNSLALKRNDVSGNIEFSAPTVNNSGRIIAAEFNDESGILTLMKADGTVMTIAGFLTQADFGVGAQGPRGVKGNDGLDGFDGDDGDDGDDGCSGAQGQNGKPGDPGPDGKDGDIGITGPIGEQGLDGLQGPVGKQGRIGHEGARGRKGPSCDTSSVGASGPGGTSPTTNFVITPTAPTDSSVLLWAKP